MFNCIKHAGCNTWIFSFFLLGSYPALAPRQERDTHSATSHKLGRSVPHWIAGVLRDWASGLLTTVVCLGWRSGRPLTLPPLPSGGDEPLLGMQTIPGLILSISS